MWGYDGELIKVGSTLKVLFFSLPFSLYVELDPDKAIEKLTWLDMVTLLSFYYVLFIAKGYLQMFFNPCNHPAILPTHLSMYIQIHI